jgi:hypothetical protein
MSVNRKPRAEHLEDLRRRLRRDGFICVVETTPQYGGSRRVDVQTLVDEGLAIWSGPQMATAKERLG